MIDSRAACATRPIKPASSEGGRSLAAEERRKRRDENGCAPREGAMVAGNDRDDRRIEARRGAERCAGDADLAQLRVQHLEGVLAVYRARRYNGLCMLLVKMLERVQQRRLRRDKKRRREEEPPEPAQCHRYVLGSAAFRRLLRRFRIGDAVEDARGIVFQDRELAADDERV